MITSLPLAGASISCTDLSLSKAYSGWPAVTVPPSGTSHSVKMPSFIENPIFGTNTCVLTAVLSLHAWLLQGAAHGRFDLRLTRRKRGFQNLRERHRREIGA